MMVRSLGLLILSFIVAAPANILHAATPLTKVLLTTGSVSEREAAIYVAQEQGYFRKYGVEVQFVQARSGPIGMARLAPANRSFTGARYPAPIWRNRRGRRLFSSPALSIGSPECHGQPKIKAAN